MGLALVLVLACFAAPGLAKRVPSQAELLRVAISAFNDEAYEVAEDQLKQFIELYGKSKRLPDALYLLGHVYFRRGKYDDAREVLGWLLNEKPDYPRVYQALRVRAQAALKLGRDEEALADLDRVIKGAKKKSFKELSLFQAGLVSYRLRQYRRARPANRNHRD